MKLFLLFAFLAVLATVTLAWEKEDYEIFDLVSAVEASEGKGTTFYSWLNVPSTASTPEIAKAYRKMSMTLHPDKNPNVKGIQERFARLGVVAKILRNKEDRQRYDFFYKNGVPKWRGTGYYYARFRPGLGSVFVFLVILTSSLQYMVQTMNYKRDLKRIDEIITAARATAWGPKMIPLEFDRKVKVKLGGSGEDGNPSNGKHLDMIVEPKGDVFIYEPNGETHQLDKSSAVPPTVSGTWFIALFPSIYHKLSKMGKGDTSTEPQEPNDDEDSSTSASEGPGSGTITPKDDSPAGLVKRRGAAVSKTGGRRKNIRKR